jgi:O-antigen/teichoic acid export membrane protein
MAVSFISKIVHGSFWSLLGRLLTQSLGIVSTLILARILTPYDFGIVAFAAIVTGFFELFARVGTDQYLIHKKDLSDSDIDTAWTIRLLIKIGIAFLLFLSGFFVGKFWDTDNIGLVIQVLAIVPLLAGAENIGKVLLIKKMLFKQVTLLNTVAKFISFVATVTIAYIYESYWAFIVGFIVSQLVLTIGSYIISKYRPKYCLEKISNQWSFSQWTLLKGIVNYAGSRADQILISSQIGIRELGNFEMAQKIRLIPSELLLSPITDVLFPALAETKGNMDDFREKTQKMMFMLILVSVPMACGLIFVSDPLITLALGSGDKWVLVKSLLVLLAPMIIWSSLTGNLFGVITTLGKTKLLFKFELVTTVISLPLLYVAIKHHGLEQLLLVRNALSAAFCFALIILVAKLIGLSLVRFIVNTVIAVFCNMLVFVVSFKGLELLSIETNPFAQLLISGSLFVIVFIVITLLLFTALKNKNSDIEFAYNLIVIRICSFIKARFSKSSSSG